MAKVQDKRTNLGPMAEHGRAIREAAVRLELHTATYEVNTEAGRILDRRIILEELQGLMARLGAVYAIIGEGR